MSCNDAQIKIKNMSTHPHFLPEAQKFLGVINKYWKLLYFSSLTQLKGWGLSNGNVLNKICLKSTYDFC